MPRPVSYTHLEALTFSAEGVAEGASAVTVKSNRPWTLAFESGADWVTPSATDGLSLIHISERNLAAVVVRRQTAVEGRRAVVQFGFVVVVDISPHFA